MSEYRITGETLMGIADAIRAKRGYSGAIPVPSFAGEIASIQAGGGTCTEPHVIEVEVLPDAGAVDVNAVYLCGGRYYKYTSATLENVYVYLLGQWVDYIQLMVGVGLPPENASYNVIPTKNTSGLLESDGTNSFHLYYVEDEDNIFIYGGGQFFAIEDDPDTTVTNGGAISDISQATDTSKYYAVLSQGGWKEWIPKEECGGGAELNIAYGDTPPEDTSKLWCKCDEPEAVQIVPPSLVGANATATTSGEIELLEETLPQKMTYIASATVGTKIYLFGGAYPNTENGITSAKYVNTIFEFDTETKTLTTLSATSLERGNMSAEAVGTKIYLFGGKNVHDAITAICKFDTETKTRTTLSATLTRNSSSVASSAVGTKIYLFGADGSSFSANIWEFDTETETLTTLSATLPKSTSKIASATVGTKIYLFGGTNLNTILEFNAETKTLTTLSEIFPNKIRDMSAEAVGTKIYLFGGEYVDTIYVFDTETKTLKLLTTTLPQTMASMASGVVGSSIYLFGGMISSVISSALDTIYEFSASFHLPENNLIVVASLTDNLFSMLPNVVIGVKETYIGNADDEGEKIEAALYKDGEWTNI